VLRLLIAISLLAFWRQFDGVADRLRATAGARCSVRLLLGGTELLLIGRISARVRSAVRLRRRARAGVVVGRDTRAAAAGTPIDEEDGG
jgi:hypothetical protein